MGCNSSSRTGGISIDEDDLCRTFPNTYKKASLWAANRSGSPSKRLKVTGDASIHILSLCSELKKICMVGNINSGAESQTSEVFTIISPAKAKDLEVRGRNIILEIGDITAYASFVDEKALQETVTVFKIFRESLLPTSAEIFQLMDDTLLLIRNKHNELDLPTTVVTLNSAFEELDQKRSSTLLEEIQLIELFISQLATMLGIYGSCNLKKEDAVAEAHSILLSIILIMKKCRRIDQSVEEKLSFILNSLITAFCYSHTVNRDVSSEKSTKGATSEFSSSSSVQSGEFESCSLLKLINDVISLLKRRSIASNISRQQTKLDRSHTEDLSIQTCNNLESTCHLQFTSLSLRRSNDRHTDTESKESFNLSPSHKSRVHSLSSQGKFDEGCSPAIRPTFSLSNKNLSTLDDFSYKAKTSPAYRNSLLAAMENYPNREKPELIKLDFSEGSNCLVDDEYGFFDVESST